ncbi:MAG: tyrosine-type recombinase/integrase [Planctomycetota bacterium]
MKTPQTMLKQAEEYLNFRRQLGYQLRSGAYLLREFGRYADQSGHTGPITTELVLRWVRLRQNAKPNYLARRLHVIRCLARHRALFDPRTEIPEDDSLKLRRVRPYIYTECQIGALMTAARGLAPTGGLRPRTYQTLFGLLASTGMRVGEALRLQKDDVDLEAGVLRINNSKFTKSRLVPVHATTLDALRRYAAFRDRYHRSPKDAAFLLSERGTALLYDAVEDAFAQIRARLGWSRTCPGRPPRIHDLRHTFACRRLLQWYREKADVEHVILTLSTYLGHRTVGCTYWYLTGIPELLALCAARFAQFAQARQGGES